MSIYRSLLANCTCILYVTVQQATAHLHMQREQINSHTAASCSSNDADVVMDSSLFPPALKRFKFLSEKLQQSNTGITQAANSLTTSASLLNQLEQYMTEVQNNPTEKDAITFWRGRHASYSLLAPLAEDLVASPAYVERIFSLCGWLTAGRRNRLTTNLEMRVFLKLNKQLCE